MDHDEHRDRPLGDAIDQIPIPARSESFMPDLLRSLEAEDARRLAPADGAGGKGRLWRLLARRKGSLLAAAALAAALVVIFTLSGVPGMRETQPPAATAADRLVAAIDAGLAKVNTMQGVMVFDPPFGSQSRRLAVFAATSAGDRLVDVRYKPDWKGALEYYRAQLSALRKAKAHYSADAYNRALKDLKGSLLVAATRRVFVVSAVAHTSGYAFFYSDAITHKLARVKYVDFGWESGLSIPLSLGDVGRIWGLATQLRSMMVDNPDITVSDTTYQGRAASKVVVQATGGSPAWEAIVDKQFGVTLAVRVIQSPPYGGTGSDTVQVIAFHVERLRINRPLSPATFAIKPDYRSASTAHVHVASAPQVDVLDMAAGSPAVHVYAPAELASVASGSELVPEATPAGFRMTEIARFGDDRGSVLLVYRRGMNEFVIGSGPRVPNTVVSDSGGSPAPGIAAFDRETWPWGASSEFIRIHGGALNGAPSTIFAGVGGPAELAAWTDTGEATVAGDLSRAEILAIAGSLRPLKGGGWGKTTAGLVSTLGVIVALVAAGATLLAWLVARRRRRSIERPQLSVLAWPLVGLALVIAGAGLNWHALLHNGTGYASRGWNEPLGRWVIALAVLAVITCAWRQLVTTWRGPVGPKLLAVLLAMATLAGAAFALVYLPLEARFTVSNLNGDSVTSESWLMRIFSSQFSPSATTGLYISILGALFLLVGVVMLRRPEQTVVDDATVPVPGVSSPSTDPPA
jgi:hypothetical protein